MDIGAKNSYPAGALSNFSGHAFVLDGVFCGSFEGFLQSLKFKNPDMQVEICKLVGYGAKKAGKKKNWQRDLLLYWRGVPIHRYSVLYQELISKAYDAMFEQSESFRRALKAAGNATFTHSIGKTKPSETVLTINEFVSNLNRLRAKL